MAKFLWRYRRRILICICTPCMLVVCLLIYVTLAVCLAMANSILPIGPHGSFLPSFFIATGATNSGSVAPYPIKPFWNPDLYKEAFWNLIQHDLDLQHNPILRPNAGRNVSIPDTKITNSTWPKDGCSPNYEIMWSMSNFFTLPSQMQKFVMSMHCRDYPLLINQPGLCGNTLNQNGFPTLLLAIKSQAQNFENRRAIRRTWGRSGWMKGHVGRGGVVRRVFLLGYTEPKNDTEEKLQKESEKYGDILRWNFVDSFFNLTLKDVLFWDWFSKHCPHSRYVFKGDDDVFVRTPALLDYLQNEEKVRSQSPGSSKNQEDFVVGDVITSAVPLRLKDNKYFIPDTFYKGMYPSYAGGGGVVYSGSLVHRLFHMSKRVHLFPIDDVYLGMCLQRLGVIPIHHPAFLTFDFPKDEAKNPCAHHTILLVHKRSPKEMMKLWTEIWTPSSKCSNVKLRVDVPGKKAT